MNSQGRRTRGTIGRAGVPARARPWAHLVLSVVTAAGGLYASAAALTPGTASAAAPSRAISMRQEDFRQSQLDQPGAWQLPALTSGRTNVACLTASSTAAQAPLPGCPGTADAPGTGALRLTGSGTGLEGGVVSSSPLPTGSGLDFTFDTYQYAGSSTTGQGDGISFFLDAADPTGSGRPPALGQPGAGLGYSSTSTGAGMSDAYLGVGLDVYGNYTTRSADGSGCSDPSWAGTSSPVPNQVTVRGPGFGRSGYCLLSSSSADGGLNGALASGTSQSRAASLVPVEVAVNPTGTPEGTLSGLPVPAYSYVVAVTPLGSATQVFSGTLPFDTYLPVGDGAWASPTTGVPYQVYFGFAASTGAAIDTHEVSNLEVAPLTAASPPVLGLSLSDDAAGVLVKGATVHYTASGLVAGTGGNETAAPVLQLSFPPGLTPASAVGTAWSCSTYATTATCEYKGTLPLSAGTTLPPVTVPAVVASNAAGPQVVSGTLSEAGSVGATATDYGTLAATAPSTPVLGLSLYDSDAGRLAQGGQVTYTVASRVSSAAPAPGPSPEVTVDLGAGAEAVSVTGSGWACGALPATTLSCSWTGAAPSPGTALAPLQVSADVNAVASGTSGTTAEVTDGAASASAADPGVVASLPEYRLSVSDSSSGQLSPHSSVVYTVDANEVGSSAAETSAPVVTVQFPPALTGVSEDTSSASEWSCTPVATAPALSETCTYKGALPISGSALVPLVFDTTVKALATGYTADVAASITSPSTGPTTADDYARVNAPPAPNFSISTSAPATTRGPYQLSVDGFVLSSGGTDSAGAKLGVTLPANEVFASTPSVAGWSCSLPGPARLSCTTAGPFGSGTPLPGLVAKIQPRGTGLHTAQLVLQDTGDGAFAVSTSSTTVSVPPVLALSTAGAPTKGSAGSTFEVPVAASTDSSGGEAYNDLSLQVDLSGPATISSAPAGPGWLCSLGGGSQHLSCTYAVSADSPLPPGYKPAPLSLPLHASADATGTLVATFTLGDANDGATAVTQVVAVAFSSTPTMALSASAPAGVSAGTTYALAISPGVGTAGGPAYSEPGLSVSLPTGQTVTTAGLAAPGWKCTVAAGGGSFACTSTTSLPANGGSSLGDVTATVAVSPTAGGRGTVQATLSDTADGALSALAAVPVDVTPPPVLALAMSGPPANAYIGTTYQLHLSPATTSAGGPAYHAARLTVALPAGESFAPVPSPAGWSCSAASPGQLSCTSVQPTPAGPGSLGAFSAQVAVGPGTPPAVTVTATLSDPLDAAAPATVSNSGSVSPLPQLSLQAVGTPQQAPQGSSYQLSLEAALLGTGGPAHSPLSLSVTLPSGETFGPVPAVPGWTCTLGAAGTALGCSTSSPLPLPAPTTLPTLAVPVQIGAKAWGTLTTVATLSDGADGATPVTVTPAVAVTSTGPTVMPLPVVTVSTTTTTTLPTTTTTAPGSATTVPGATTSTTTPSYGTTTTAPGPSTTTTSTLPTTTTTVPSSTTTVPGGGKAGTGPEQPVVLPPVLQLSLSAPKSAVAGGHFTLAVAAALAAKGGPAYHGATFSIDLPVGLRFPGAPAAAGWTCSSSAAGTVLVCSWDGHVPVAAGSGMGIVSTTVDVAKSATGTAVVKGTLTDTPDAARQTTAAVAVRITQPQPRKSSKKKPAHPKRKPAHPKKGHPGKGGKNAQAKRFGYRLAAADGGVFAFGNARFSGSCDVKRKPCGAFKVPRVTGTANAPGTRGYWLVATTGGVFSFGGAHFHGSCPQVHKPCGRLSSPVVGMAATRNGGGYWLVSASGSVYAFGNAHNFGSCTRGARVCRAHHPRVVGIAATPDDRGYWLAAANGSVWAFGDASRTLPCRTSAKACARVIGHVVAITATTSGRGYWLTESTGRVLAFGNARFLGDAFSTGLVGRHRLKSAVVGTTAMANGDGYWLVCANGQVVALKAARFVGDIQTTRIKHLRGPIVAIAST